MAFPSGWSRKCPITIDADMVPGELSHDLIILLDQRALPDEMVTSGGANACQEGGGDIRFSADQAGSTQLACEITRCALDATPANSRVMCYVRVPDVSDAVDTVIYVWYHNAEASMPDEDDPYGTHDVWNSTDEDAPTFYEVHHWHDNPVDPAPQFSDSSTSDYEITIDTGSLTTREGISDGVPGRGSDYDSTGARLCGDSGNVPAPGTSGFSVLCFFKLESTAHTHTIWQYQNESTFFIIQANSNSLYPKLDNVSGQTTGVTPSSWTDPMTAGFVRNGDTLYVYCDGQLEESHAGFSSADVGGAGTYEWWGAQYSDLKDVHWFEAWYFSVAINTAYQAAVNRNFTDLTTYITAGTPEAAALQLTIYFDGLHSGSEVRIYETPHEQIWTCECVADDGGSLGGTYMTFEVQNESGTTAYYAWFDVDDGSVDPEPPDRTGVEVDISEDDSAADVASALAGAIDALGDVGASAVSDIVTITNGRNGETEEPFDIDTGCTVSVTQIGGTSTAEIDGIEDSTGTSWIGDYEILRPRKYLCVMHHEGGYEYSRFTGILQLTAMTIPAGAMQRQDRNFSNPS
jgi:hypothetical protein